MDGMGDVLQAINTGGNAALVVCIWFLYKVAETNKEVATQLARIEKALSKYLEESQK